MTIWIGVEFGGDWEIVSCTALKDLARECGFSYRGAMKRGVNGESFMMRGLKSNWMVKESEVKKVAGRGGNFRKN